MWVIALLGCTSPEIQGFLEDRAAAICARHARCDTLGPAGYASESACLAAIADSDDDAAGDGTLGCADFDRSSADICLSAYDAACDEVPELDPCDAVCG